MCRRESARDRPIKQRSDLLGRVVLRQRRQVHPPHAVQALPSLQPGRELSRLVLGPAGHHDRHPGIPARSKQIVEQLACFTVRPVHVLDDHCSMLPSTPLSENSPDRIEHPTATGIRLDLPRRLRCAGLLR